MRCRPCSAALESPRLRRPRLDDALTTLGGTVIPKYLIQASYTATGTKGLLKEGGSRCRTAVNILMKELGGSVEAFYCSFGESDVVAIVDVPDNVTAAALSLTIGASDRLTLRTTPLLDPSEIDEATKKTVKYSPPGS